MSPSRWKYLKALKPAPGRLVHQSCAVAMIPQKNGPSIPWIERPGKTLNLGRNAAKRELRKQPFWRPLPRAARA